MGELDIVHDFGSNQYKIVVLLCLVVIQYILCKKKSKTFIQPLLLLEPAVSTTLAIKDVRVPPPFLANSSFDLRLPFSNGPMSFQFATLPFSMGSSGSRALAQAPRIMGFYVKSHSFGLTHFISFGCTP